ncbi:MAG: uridine kinase family protein [Acetivibrionales bacterium]|jgi:uridine kinase
MLSKWQIDGILERTEQLLREKEPVIIAIDGNSGAGKSTLAEQIRNYYNCNVFHMDDFFLPPGLKTDERLNETGGNVDYVRFRNEVANQLMEGGVFEYRVYNCRTQSFDKTVSVKPNRLNVIEGVYSMHPKLIDIYDLKIFLSIDKQKQLRRILERSGPELYKKFINLWIPLENTYFDKMRIREQSDFVF